MTFNLTWSLGALLGGVAGGVLQAAQNGFRIGILEGLVGLLCALLVFSIRSQMSLKEELMGAVGTLTNLADKIGAAAQDITRLEAADAALAKDIADSRHVLRNEFTGVLGAQRIEMSNALDRMDARIEKEDARIHELEKRLLWRKAEE